MNELIFLIHIFTVSAAVLVALRLGKEALICLIGLSCILANLFVCKQITLFGFTPTASDAVAVSAALGLNVLQEYFGKKAAQFAIWTSFAGCIFYTLLSLIHLAYEPTAFDMTQGHYYAILSPAPRLIIASLISYFISQQTDYRIFGLLKDRMAYLPFYMRSFISAALSQLVDTISFSFLGLYGIMENMLHVIIISYLIKLVIILCSGPFLHLTKKIISKQPEAQHEPI